MRFWHRVQGPDASSSRLMTREDNRESIPLKDRTVIWLSGGLTTDDPPLSQETLKGRTLSYFGQMFPYINLADETVVADLTGKVDEYCAGNINLVDKLLGFSYKTNVEKQTKTTSPDNDHVKVYCVSYKSTEKLLYDHEQCCSNPNHFFCDEAMEMVQRLFMPLLSTEGKVTYVPGGGIYDCSRWKVEGKKRSVEEIIPALKKLTFTGNSYGTSFLLQIENALTYAMKDLHYSSAEQKAMMQSVCAIMISNISAFKATSGQRFTAVYLEGINDRVAKICNPHFKTETDENCYYPPIPKDERGVPLKINGKQADSTLPYFRIQPCLEKNRVLVLSDVNRKMEFWKERSGYFDYAWVDNDHTGHHVSHYTMRGTPYSSMPDIVERSLRNAVCRDVTPVTAMQDFFRPCELWKVGDAALTLEKTRSDTLTGLIRNQFKSFPQKDRQLNEAITAENFAGRL